MIDIFIRELVNIFFDSRDRKRRAKTRLQMHLPWLERLEKVHYMMINNYINLLNENRNLFLDTEYQDVIDWRTRTDSWHSAIRNYKVKITKANISNYADCIGYLAKTTLNLCQK